MTVQESELQTAAVPADADIGDTVDCRYPDFLCIGAHKSGTTWLDSNLRGHPGLWLPPIKELQYFNELHIKRSRRWTSRQRTERAAAILRHYVEKTPEAEWDYPLIARMADIADGAISDDWYGRIFTLARPDQRCGEVSSDYFLLRDAGIRHVLTLMPRARLLFTLRDPIERSWSHIRMTARHRDISSVEDFERFARQKEMVRRADYPAILARWTSFTPRDRMLVLFMDDIVRAPLAVLERVCDFLGVAFDPAYFANAAEAVHAGQPLDIPPSVYETLKRKLRPVYDDIAVLFPEVGAAWTARHY